MTKFMKYSLAWCLVLVLLIPMLGISASASEVSYASSGEYIYNWGIRGEVATFLSPNAKAFYEANKTSYDILSSYTGGTSQSNAPSSELYRELKTLMTKAHTHINNYNETRDLFQYTDCQNGGGKISSFYSGKMIGPSWDGGWNREHTWPNSKGLAGSDEDDLMMLRPTSVSENSSRGNMAYGKSSGYYHPNSESNGEYDLRGDVARICLYVYVRWGNTGYMWGASGVIESLDVLLEWMEADPVDTWELGRNDSVESITGTRNVFVDYPELAFILFGEEIPENMMTPSAEGEQDCGHNNFDSGVVFTATCINKGYTLYTCQTAGCEYSYKTNVTLPNGHNYVAVVTQPTCTQMGYTTYVCSVCENSYAGDNIATVPHNYQNNICTACGAEKSSSAEVTISFADVSNRTLITKTQQVWSKDGVSLINNKASATSDVADYKNPVRLYAGSSVTIEASGNITKIEFDCNSSSYATTLQKSIGSSAALNSDKVTVVLDGSSNTFTIAKLTAQVRLDAVTVSCADAEPTCQHTNTATDSAVAPTCTATGLTEGKHCVDCGKTLVTQQTVSALGHTYASAIVNPTCTEQGYTTYTCDCGENYVDHTIDALGHTPSEWIVDVEAQIGVSGSRHKECTVCNETLETEVIEALTEAETTEAETTEAETTREEDSTAEPPATELEKDSQEEPESSSDSQSSGGCNGTIAAFTILFALTASCAVLCKKRDSYE